MLISPTLPTNIKGELTQELLILAEEVCIKSAALLSGYNPQLKTSIQDLLRITNSYYSNRIEAQSTHPIEIEKAMKKKFSSDSKEKSLQKLSIAHIQTQKYVESYCKRNKEVINREFIKLIHKEFYEAEGMDNFLMVEGHTMVAGEFRNMDVEDGKHIAPTYSNISGVFNYFEHEYKKVYFCSTKAKKLLAALSSHHRLAYLHPFLDGNGRVSRLHLDAMLLKMGLDGYGLWNISRGLARDVAEYQKYLGLADMKKQGAKDGNGELSLRGLEYYLKFMLKTALDQIEFMGKRLQITELDKRLSLFVRFSQEGLFGAEILPKHSELLFTKLLVCGELPRGEVKDVIGKATGTASTLIKNLLAMEYLESDTPRGAVRLKLNTFFASKLIPDLIPEN